MDLDNLIDERNVDLFAKADNKNAALKEMAFLLRKNGYVTNAEQFFEDVQYRESLGPTGMENGIAIPHGESNSVLQATIAIYRTTQELEWESLDEKPIRFIFLIAVPQENRNVDHLRILSSLSALLTHEDIQSQLYDAKSFQELRKILVKSSEIII